MRVRYLASAAAAAILSLTLTVNTIQTARAESVKIGVLTDMSGAYADASGQGSVVAARLAIEDFGESLFGKKIELVSADHQNKAAVATNIARRWYDREGVTMITDLTNSAVAIAVQNLSKEKRRINLVTSTASTALTNEECSPYGVHWTFDSYALSAGTGRAIVQSGGKKWFFITANYTFGENLEATATKEITAAGGAVIGHALAPLNTTDFSSHLLQAKESGADVIGLANSGADTANAVKQANEFGLTKNQKLAAFLPFITDIRSMGLKNAQGLVLTTAFYWDRTPESRAWSERFFKASGAMPTMIQAGTYSAVLHYLRAVKEAGSLDADLVTKKLRELPVSDPVFPVGRIRADGRMVHDMYLVQVKKPEESARDWDFYTVLRTIPADEAFQPLSATKCSLVKGS